MSKLLITNFRASPKIWGCLQPGQFFAKQKIAPFPGAGCRHAATQVQFFALQKIAPPEIARLCPQNWLQVKCLL
jgi:hypothetical protein